MEHFHHPCMNNIMVHFDILQNSQILFFMCIVLIWATSTKKFKRKPFLLTNSGVVWVSWTLCDARINICKISWMGIKVLHKSYFDTFAYVHIPCHLSYQGSKHINCFLYATEKMLRCISGYYNSKVKTYSAKAKDGSHSQPYVWKDVVTRRILFWLYL